MIPENVWLQAAAYRNLHKGKQGLSTDLDNLFGITLRALDKKIKANNLKASKLGGPTKLTFEEEEELEKMLRAAQDAHACMTREALCRNAAYVLGGRTGKVEKPLTKKWLKGFLRRHPSLGPRKARTTTTRRENAFTQKASDDFYRLLEHLTRDIPPERIYIMDETHLQWAEKTNVSQW